MSAPPKTVLAVSPQEEAAIRAAVRAADPKTLGHGRVLTEPAHAEGLLALLSDPRVSDPIYDLPRPFTLPNVQAWIADFAAKRAAGDGLLMTTLDAQGAVGGYSQITVWPDRSAAELAGALRAEMQSAGGGGAGALATFGWIFKTLGVRMMCLTAALDNVRSARLIDRAGFRRMDERDALRADGSIRRSIYWEITAEEFRGLWG